MKKFVPTALCLGAVVGALLVGASVRVEAARIPPFTAEAIDFTGPQTKKVPFDSHANDHVTVYFVAGTTCSATKAYAERLQHLEREYRAKGVDFVYVYPNRDDTVEEKLAFHKQKQLGGRLVDDQGGRIARLLGAQRTSEVFVADKQGEVVFHGAVDDSRDPKSTGRAYLAPALDETLAGKPVSTPFSKVFA
jgi:thiol-disulfide isomerase/thioredoxin